MRLLLCCTPCGTDSPSTRWPNSAPSCRFWCAASTTINGITLPENPSDCVTKEEFLAAVTAGLDDIGPIDPEDATRAVFAVLEHHIAPGEIEDVKAILPTHLRDLWP